MAGLRKKQRIQLIVASFVALGLATALIGYAMRDGIALYRDPAAVIAAPPEPDEVFRMGGIVVAGSIIESDGLHFTFDVTDCLEVITVAYIGMEPRPDLFQEGQATIATGRLIDGRFEATALLAKHDESYMPREVANSMADVEACATAAS